MSFTNPYGMPARVSSMGPSATNWFHNFDLDFTHNMAVSNNLTFSEAPIQQTLKDLESVSSAPEQIPSLDENELGSEEAITDDIAENLTKDVTESVVEDVAADAAVTSISDVIDPITAGIGLGLMGSDIVSGLNAMTINQVDQANVAKPGAGAAQEASMIDKSLNSSASAQHSFMTAGALVGGPLGALLGYAFAPALSASSLNFNIAYSSGGMVDPELQNTVTTGFATQESASNPNIMETQ